MHDELSVAPQTLLYSPAPQPAHTAAESAPTLALNLPAGHGEQPTVPVVSALYLPAPHAVHADAVAVSMVA